MRLRYCKGAGTPRLISYSAPEANWLEVSEGKGREWQIRPTCERNVWITAGVTTPATVTVLNTMLEVVAFHSLFEGNVGSMPDTYVMVYCCVILLVSC